MNNHHRGSTYLYNAIKKHGKNTFTPLIIEYCEIKKLNEREQYYIKEWNTKAPNGYNLTDGGDGMSGWITPLEVREKISIARRGQSVSFETKKKISKFQKGRAKSLETREKIGNANRNPSDKTREKLSKANSGENNPNYGKSPSDKTREKNARANRGKKKNGASSLFIGIIRIKGKDVWVARASVAKKTEYIGRYKNEVEAAHAFDKYIIKNNLPSPINFPLKGKKE